MATTATSQTISTAPLEHVAMDYTFLRQEGIRYLEQIAGQLWTDFNVHDPGITILEQLCFALTDLAHRINYNLPDLLTDENGQTYDSLFTPAQILSSNPVTLIDLRKLVIDVDGVKNAWVEKVEQQTPALYFNQGNKTLELSGNELTTEPVYLKGLFKVFVELSDILYIDNTAGERGKSVRQKVAERLHAHRGLCEDFTEIKILDPQEIQIDAHVEIGDVDNADDILLAIYQRIANYISPPIEFLSLEQRLAKNDPVENIFDGPLLTHGFIDSAQLKRAQRRTMLYISDLIREMMDIPAVHAVRHIRISTGAKWEDWSLELDPQRSPRMNLAQSNIQLERKHVMANVDVATVKTRYTQQLRHTAVLQATAAKENDITPPVGKNRHVGNYYSIQHQFPEAYGIGTMGLPQSASPERKAQAKQLKAYLIFYDQLLANYFSQLAHAKDLFSFNKQNRFTYFAQSILDAKLGLEGIRELEPAHSGRLQQITENPYTANESIFQTITANSNRQNRFLNHLLARFAEQFTDYSLLLYGALASDTKTTAEKLATDKQAFLQNYPYISSRRGTAFNYLKPRDANNLSGLENRIKYKLGLTGEETNLVVVEHILLRPLTQDLQQELPILADTAVKDPYSLQISFMLPSWPARFQESNNSGFRTFVERTIYEETPAHLLVHIRWLNKKEMALFTAVYDEWIEKVRTYWQQTSGA